MFDLRLKRKSKGFTMIELIVVMVLIGILSGIVFIILRGPMQAYIENERRARLVDVAETALQRMTREIRLALPYSIRRATSAGIVSLEFLRTFDGGRYRARGAGRLKFTPGNNNQTFTVLSKLTNPGGIQTGSQSVDCLNSSAYCLVIYNIGQPLIAPTAVPPPDNPPSANAYLGASDIFDGNIATISAVGASGGFDELTFDNSDLPSWNYGLQSPNQRFHIVDTAVSFVCNINTGEINRYYGYPITQSQSTAPGGTANLLIDQVTACDFTVIDPTSSRAGLLTMKITITDPVSSQSVTLLQQVHLDNVP